MPTYVALGKWTEQGIKNVRNTTSRGDEVRAQIEQAGGRLVGLWWTQGAYDVVGVFEMPDDESYSALALSIAMVGNIRTESMRAFSAEEFGRVIQKLA